MSNQENENFENPTKWSNYDNDYIDCDVKVKIIVIPLENIKSLQIKIVIWMLN